jgi:hypothetical protein
VQWKRFRVQESQVSEKGFGARFSWLNDRPGAKPYRQINLASLLLQLAALLQSFGGGEKMG